MVYIMSDKHPIQPLYVDEEGTLRFKANAIVRYLLDYGGLNLIDLAIAYHDGNRPRFTTADWTQFYQLIGYSHSGAVSLEEFDTEEWEVAMTMYQGKDEKDARIAYLEDCLATVRKACKEFIPTIFRIHEDDLKS